jgi:hypothetical protein
LAVHHSLIAFASVLLSGGESWLSDPLVDAPTRAGNAPITPTEPSTLALALVGIGTIAIYLVATGRWRRRDAKAKTGRLRDRSARPPALDRVKDRRSRGAA